MSATIEDQIAAVQSAIYNAEYAMSHYPSGSPLHLEQQQKRDALRAALDTLATNNREVERRREAETEVERLQRLVELPRASDLISALKELVERQREWKVTDIRAAVHASGIEATDKQIANGLAYLTRRGKARRLGYGRYAPAGGSIGMVAQAEVKP